MGPSQAAALGLGKQAASASGMLVALASTAIEEGSRFELNAKTLTIGRGAPNDIRLDDDEFASIKLHPTRGFEMVNGISFLDEATLGIRHHHERVSPAQSTTQFPTPILASGGSPGGGTSPYPAVGLNQHYWPDMVKHMEQTAPAGADLKSWKY